MASLTESSIKERAGAFDLSSILRLDLSSMGLGCLANMHGLVHLEELSLFGNELRTLEGIAAPELRKLDAANNELSSAAPLAELAELEVVELQGNRIAAAADLAALARLPRLRALRLRDEASGASNPMCAAPSYFEDICALLPNLAVLDGERLELKQSMLAAARLRVDAADAAAADGEIEVPQPKPWCGAGSSFSWEGGGNGEAQGARVAASAAEARHGAAKQLKDALAGCVALRDRADNVLRDEGGQDGD
jgi:hypothetical protein